MIVHTNNRCTLYGTVLSEPAVRAAKVNFNFRITRLNGTPNYFGNVSVL